MQVQNVTFGARYIKSATIQKKENDKLVDHKISMVELNPYDIYDVIAINELSIDWGGADGIPSTYAKNMCNIFMELSEQKTSRFYALTQQKGNFERLNSELILSIAEISCLDKKVQNLDLLETFFEEAHNSKNAKFKHIGQAMVDNLKLLYKGKDILAEVLENAEKFYIKQGFEKVEGGINRYIFKSIKF